MAVRRMRVYRERHWPRWAVWILVPLVLAALIACFWWYDTTERTAGKTVELALLYADGTPCPDDAEVLGLIDTSMIPVGEWEQQKLISASDGRWRATHVTPGNYWLFVDGALTGVDVTASTGQVMQVAVDPRAYNVTFRFSDASGAPLVHTDVDVAQYALYRGTGVTRGQTDWQGVYVWRDAPAGVYSITVEGMSPLLFAVEPGDVRDISVNVICYPLEDDPPIRQIRLLKSNGDPLRGAAASLTLYGLPGGKEIVWQQFGTDADGAFSCPLNPGDYTLRVDNRRFKLHVPADASSDLQMTFRL